MRVYIFGDSIAQGYFDTQSSGWANHIAAHYQQEALKDLGGEWIEVFNLGVSGDTVQGVLDRMTQEVEARRLSDDEECMVLAVGINDAKLADNLPAHEEYDFQTVYEQLLDEALGLCPRVICVGLTAVHERIVNTGGAETFHTNRINLFEDIIKQSALRKEVAFVPVHDAFASALTQQELLADGLHPNSAGHAFIAKRVLEAIEALR